MGTNQPMGSDLVKALSNPFESAVHDCARLSSESDCNSACCSCHAKTVAAEEGLASGLTSEPPPADSEIEVETKESG